MPKKCCIQKLQSCWLQGRSIGLWDTTDYNYKTTIFVLLPFWHITKAKHNFIVKNTIHATCLLKRSIAHVLVTFWFLTSHQQTCSFCCHRWAWTQHLETPLVHWDPNRVMTVPALQKISDPKYFPWALLSILYCQNHRHRIQKVWWVFCFVLFFIFFPSQWCYRMNPNWLNCENKLYSLQRVI